MSPQSRLSRLVPLLILLPAISVAASAQRSQGEDRAEFGKNITVAAGETSGDIACGRCSVYVRGTVNGDVAVFAGRVIVEGTVKGDIAAFMGRVRLENGAHVGGDIAVFGGRISRDPTAIVGGDVKAMGAGWLLLPVLVFVVLVALIVALIVWLVTRRQPAPPLRRGRAPCGRCLASPGSSPTDQNWANCPLVGSLQQYQGSVK